MTTDWFVSISCIAMTDLSTQRIHCTIGCVRSESSRVNSLQLHHRKNCVHSINLLFSNWVQVWFISVFLFCSFINVIMKCAPKIISGVGVSMKYDMYLNFPGLENFLLHSSHVWACPAFNAPAGEWHRSSSGSGESRENWGERVWAMRS